MKKARLTILAGFLATVFLFTVSCPVFAQAVWVEGEVTDKQSTGRIHHIQLDDKKIYLLMKDCRIDWRIQTRPGAYIEKPVDFGYIRIGQRVTIKAEDNRCYQVLILQ
ncbi:MAG: hypothetical protein CVU57_13105 [Deltaproteobacteria bacterium HGW-Deltaproteobacteria-15]|jgi:hypothetical protein|nr:MAG: hypothetical protein CVU57_13105 [Deltaproteobacteria bacterium HGW-Deltaproteobacteria-15]